MCSTERLQAGATPVNLSPNRSSPILTVHALIQICDTRLAEHPLHSNRPDDRQWPQRRRDIRHKGDPRRYRRHRGYTM